MAESEDVPADLTSPIQRLDEVAIFGRPRMWVALTGALVLISGFLVWGVLARPPVMTSASGVISTTGGPLEVGAGLDGAVTSVYVSVGTNVEAGNVLAVLIDQAGREVRATTPVAGTVIEVATQEGDFIRSGQGIATIQRFDENLLALALVPASSITGIVEGDEALVSPNSVPAGQYGYLKGVVTSVASTPMSVSRLEQLVMSVAGYPTIDTIDEPLIEVQIVLAADETTPSGLSWTIGTGPPFTLVAGTPWSGNIVIGNQAPLATLFGPR